MRHHQFETYLDKVFDWNALVAAMTEGRHNPPHPWPKVFDAVFLGSACQLVRFTGSRRSARTACSRNGSDR